MGEVIHARANTTSHSSVEGMLCAAKLGRVVLNQRARSGKAAPMLRSAAAMTFDDSPEGEQLRCVQRQTSAAQKDRVIKIRIAL
jgi:hypothetical protein